MAVYEVVGPNGVTYEVNGPAGATQAQLARAVSSQVASEEESERDDQALRAAMAAKREALYGAKFDEDAGFFENIATGFGAGAVDVGEMAALGGAALLDEEAETSVRDKIQSAAKAVRPEGGDPEAVSYKLSQALGSIVGIAAPAALAAAAAPAGLAATVVGTGVAGALATGAGAGEASERARAAGATEEERSTAAARGAPIGMLDVLPIGRFLKVVDIPVLTKIIDKIGDANIEGIGNRLKRIGGTAGVEGVQEAASGFLQNLNESGYNEEVDLAGGILEEAGYGAGAGGILQMLVDFKRVRGKAGAGATDKEIHAQLQLPAPAPMLQLAAPLEQLEGPPDFIVPPRVPPVLQNKNQKLRLFWGKCPLQKCGTSLRQVTYNVRMLMRLRNLKLCLRKRQYKKKKYPRNYVQKLQGGVSQ